MVSRTSRRFNKEQQEIIINRYLNGESCNKLVKEYECQWNTISRIIKMNGIVIPSKNSRNFDKIDKNEIINLYQQGFGYTRISQLTGISDSTIGIIIRQSEPSRRKLNPKIDVDVDYICQLFNKGYLVKEIVKETGYSTWCVGRALQKSGHKTTRRRSTEQDNYYYDVCNYTKENWLNNYEKINPNKLKRSRFDYHLDHIYSRYDGFVNKIDPKIIGHWTNLQLIWWKDNLLKANTSQKSVEQLLEDYNISTRQN